MTHEEALVVVGLLETDAPARVNDFVPLLRCLLDLHQPVRFFEVSAPGNVLDRDHCLTCPAMWPCPTYEVLAAGLGPLKERWCSRS